MRVAIVGDASSYARALEKASGSTHSFGSSLLKLGKYAALGLGAAGVGGALVTLKRGFDELKESQQVMAQTAAGIKSTGGAANVTAKQVGNLATEISKMSGIDDEAVQAGENMLLTFTKIRNETGKGNDVFNQATLAVADFATRMNQGAIPSSEQLAKASILVGKALNDPIKGLSALGRAGVQFTAAQKEQITALIKSGDTMKAQKIILAELSKEFAGSAKAAGQTLPGQLSKLKNAFDEVAGNLAAKLLPALTEVVSWINDHWPQITNVMNTVANAVGTAITATANVIENNWGTIKQKFSTILDGIIEAGQGLISFFRTDLGQATAAGAASVIAMGLALSGVLKVVKLFTVATAAIGGGPTAAVFALATAVAYLGIKTGLLHLPFSLAASETQKLIDKFREVASAANTAADAFNKLAQSDLDVASAKLRVTESTHAVEAALKAQQQASDGTTKVTLAEKQANDQVARAKLDHKQAVLDLTAAERGHKEATDGVTKSLQSQLPSLLGVLQRVQAAGEAHGRAAEAIKTAGAALEKTGEQAYKASFAMKDASPAAQLATRSMAILQTAAGTLAASLGRVPSKKEIVAEAKLEGGPVFIAGLKAFVAEAEKTGVKVPQWIRSAIAPTAKAAQDVAAGVLAAKPAMLKAGDALGFSIVTGISAGIYAAMPVAIQAGLTAVANVIGAMRTAAAAKSPSKKTEALGKDMVEGLKIGLATLGPTLTKALVSSLGDALAKSAPAAVKGLNHVGQLIVAAAKKYGVDARAALAVAMGEGGIKFGAVGDSGHAFGPFQFNNAGGVATGKSAAEASAWANSAKGVADAIRMMADAGAKGKVGLDAITAIVRNFERPLDPSGSIRKAAEAYKTLGPQIASNIATGTGAVKTSVANQLSALVGLVKEFAPQIGIEHVRGIISGLVGKTPDIVAAAKAQMEKVVAAMAAAAQARTELKDAFKALAQGALAAFDSVTDAWVPPAQKLLDKMQLEDQINAAVGAVAEAQARIDAAINTRNTLTRNEGESDADFAARIAQAEADIKSATEQLGAAQRSYDELQLGLRAAAQKTAHDKQREADREALAADLLMLQTELDKHPEAYAATQRKIIALMKKYHVPLFTAGQKLAQAFADGLDDGIAAVAATARKLAAALEAIPGVGKSSGSGGGGVDPNSYGERGGGLPGGTSSGRGTAAMNITVNMPNYLGDKREAAQQIRQELQRIGRDNAVNPLAV